MQKPTLRQRIGYRLDRWIARGLWAMIGLLFAVTVIAALIVALAAHLWTPETAGSVWDSLWKSSMRILDAGNVMDDYETRNLAYIVLMIVAAVVGLFVTSVLIGMVTTSVQNRLECLRRGNARVLETGHTLVLGYDEHLPTILNELAIAGEGGGKAAVVVLCERDRCELESACAQPAAGGGRLRVICRSGDPTCFAALRNAGIERCARVIVLGCDDCGMIQMILAANTLLDTCGAPDTVTVSAVLSREENLDAATIAGGKRLEMMYFGRLVARIFAQTCRQTGLSTVYRELFDYRGDEIYMEPAPSLTGIPFSQAVLRYRRASVIGLKRDGRARLNPPGDTVLEAGDEMVLIASNAGAASALPESGAIDPARIRLRKPDAEKPLQLLMLGYSELTEPIIREITMYAAEGSALTVASAFVPEGPDPSANLSVHREKVDIHQAEKLEKVLSDELDGILVLAEDGEGDPDARTLTLLLQLSRHYRGQKHAPLIVSEMRRKKNQALAACTRVNDFVIGSNLAALVLTQVSQNRLLHPLFNELLTDEGNEIYIKPVSLYVETGAPVNLYTLAAAVAQSGQMLIGLRLRREEGGYDVRVNPDKEDMHVFNEDDCAVVLAED